MIKKQPRRSKREKLIRWAETVPIMFTPPINLEDARAASERHFTYCQWMRGRIQHQEVGRGGILAYLRHQHTNYDELLVQVGNRKGAEEAYKILRQRVDTVCREYLRA